IGVTPLAVPSRIIHCALQLLAMSDPRRKLPKPAKLPSLPPPRSPAPKDSTPAPRPATSRGSGSSEVPPPIVLSDSPTPPLGVPKIASFEPRGIAAWRQYLPSIDQWKIAVACVVTAAATAFAVGRSSATRVSPAASTDRPVCPDPTKAATHVPAPAPHNPDPPLEAHAQAAPTPIEVPVPTASASAAPDAEAQLATEK